MKTKSKKMAAEISSALAEITLIKSSGKKMMKKIDATAKKIVKKINKKIDVAKGKTKKVKVKKEKKAIEKLLPETTTK